MAIKGPFGAAHASGNLCTPWQHAKQAEVHVVA